MFDHDQDESGEVRTPKRVANPATAWEADIGRQFGPLSGREWLELDHWAFQELPRREYAAFRRLAAHHRVPLDGWLERQPGPPSGKEDVAPRPRRAGGRTRV